MAAEEAPAQDWVKEGPQKYCFRMSVAVRVCLPWVVYSHPNSRESISTTGDIHR